MFLPSEVEELLRMKECAVPVLAVRALGDLHGAVGEAYVVAVPPDLAVVSRRLGSDWQTVVHGLAEATEMRVEGEAPALALAWSVAGQSYTVPFASYGAEEAAALCDMWLASRQRAGQDLHAKKLARRKEAFVVPDEVPPVLALSACLQAMLQADGKVCDEELRLIERVIERPAVVEQGAALLRAVGVEGLLERLGQGLLDEPQKQCLLANLYELAMIDGHLRGSEMTLLEKFRDALGIDRERSDALEQILRTKNDLSVYSY